jgi:hypothetical protein
VRPEQTIFVPHGGGIVEQDAVVVRGAPSLYGVGRAARRTPW